MHSLEIIKLVAEVIYLIAGVLALITVTLDRSRRRSERPGSAGGEERPGSTTQDGAGSNGG